MTLVDALLLVLVLGAVTLALVVDIGALVGWLRSIQKEREPATVR
jgi:hypothetical protein